MSFYERYERHIRVYAVVVIAIIMFMLGFGYGLKQINDAQAQDIVNSCNLFIKENYQAVEGNEWIYSESPDMEKARSYSDTRRVNLSAI